MGVRELTEYFYTYNIGYSVSEDISEKTEKVLQYLLDCDISEYDIINQVMPIECEEEYLTFDSLPESLWENSILEKDIYYMHRELHLISGSNVVDVYSGNTVESNPSIEMKIQYDWKDLLEYYCSKFDIDYNMLNENKEIGALKYIYDLCAEKYNDLNAVDIILYIIDTASASTEKTISVLNLQDYLYETITFIYKIKRELEFNNYNKIIWR